MLDVASGGVFMDKTLEATRALISNMVENNKQFSVRIGSSTKLVHEIKVSANNKGAFLTQNNMLIGNKILELITMMRHMALNQQVNGVMKHCELYAAKVISLINALRFLCVCVYAAEELLLGCLLDFHV